MRFNKLEKKIKSSFNIAVPDIWNKIENNWKGGDFKMDKGYREKYFIVGGVTAIIVFVFAFVFGIHYNENKYESINIISYVDTYKNAVELIEKKVDEKILELELEINKNNSLYSSIPKDIILESKLYEEIIDLGIVVVKPLYDTIKSSNESGLVEYVYALAIENILNIDIVYDESYGWKNSHEFILAFEKYNIDLEKKYIDLKTTNDYEEIKKLSLAIIPHIIIDIETNYNNEQMKKSLSDILNLKSDEKVEVNEIDEWIKMNKNKYMMLKIN